MSSSLGLSSAAVIGADLERRLIRSSSLHERSVRLVRERTGRID
jgi:hypothetical protein